jgi:hypothetical protein
MAGRGRRWPGQRSLARHPGSPRFRWAVAACPRANPARPGSDTTLSSYESPSKLPCHREVAMLAEPEVISLLCRGCNQPPPRTGRKSPSRAFSPKPRLQCASKDERSRHVPDVRRPQAAGRGLGRRAALDRRAAHRHRRAHRAHGQRVHSPAAQARGLPPALHA